MSNRITTRVFEDVVQRLRLEIAHGALKPGDRLPTERELSSKFQVGRGSIREAVRALELFGLVDVRRGRDGGIFLTDASVKIAQESFMSLAVDQRYSLGDSLEFRKSIEPAAAALAALRASSNEVETLRQSMAMMKQNLRSTEKFVESNLLFHETIGRATRNPYFQELISSFLTRPEVVHATGSCETIARSLTHMFHARILDAIAQKDSRGAENWMLAHLSQIEFDLAQARELTRLTSSSGGTHAHRRK